MGDYICGCLGSVLSAQNNQRNYHNHTTSIFNMKQFLSDTTSSSLLNDCRDGKEEAWRRFQFLYQKLIQYWICNKRVPPSDRDDLYQDIQVSLVRSIKTFEKKKNSKFRSWLHTVVNSRIMDYYNNSQKKPMCVDFAELERQISASSLCNPSTNISVSDEMTERDIDNIERELVYAQLRHILADLYTQIQIDSFFLTVSGGLTSAQAAQKLGISPELVRQNKCRIVQRIKTDYKDLLD